jgi:RNA polymerase sigma-70 factor (ECF subfamily)
MEDREIVALYWRRDERAITETDRKYGGLCRAIAMNLLGVREDAEECVNDTWLQAWNSMPEQRPERLRAWLGRVVRNLSISRWRAAHRQKRYAGIELLLSELDECVPSPDDTQRTVELNELSALIDGWLRTLSEEDRTLCLRRYWNGEQLAALAAERNTAPGSLAQRMHRLRAGLKTKLEQEGIVL